MRILQRPDERHRPGVVVRAHEHRRLSPAGAGQERRRSFARHDRPWTLGRAPGGPMRPPARAVERAGNTEAVVVVPVPGGVPVAVGGAEVPRVVVPGAAAQHTPAGGRSGFRDGSNHPAPKEGPAQAPGVRMSGVGDPRAHPALDLLAGHGSMAPPVAQPPQSVAEAAHVPFGQAAPAAGEEDEAQELRRLARRHDAGLARVEPQPAAFEESGDAVPPLHESLGVIVEQREVVHVAQVALRPQNLLAEVVEAVEMDIGEELAGQVADG